MGNVACNDPTPKPQYTMTQSQVVINEENIPKGKKDFYSYFQKLEINENVIGNGSQGRVLLAPRKSDMKYLAIKELIIPLGSIDQNQKQIMLNKIKLTQEVQEMDYIIKIDSFFDWEERNQIHFRICKEYAENGSVKQALEQKKLNGGQFNDEEIGQFVTQVLLGLQSLQESNLAHLDIKLGNILRNKDFGNQLGDRDFFLQQSQEEQIGVYIPRKNLISKKMYMAPQIFQKFQVLSKSNNDSNRQQSLKKNEKLDLEKCDVFSVGVCVLQLALMLTSKEVENINENSAIGIQKKIDFLDKITQQSLKDLISKMLEYSEKQRYSIEQCLKHQYVQNWLLSVGKFENLFYNHYLLKQQYKQLSHMCSKYVNQQSLQQNSIIPPDDDQFPIQQINHGTNNNLIVEILSFMSPKNLENSLNIIDNIPHIEKLQKSQIIETKQQEIEEQVEVVKRHGMKPNKLQPQENNEEIQKLIEQLKKKDESIDILNQRLNILKQEIIQFKLQTNDQNIIVLQEYQNHLMDKISSQQEQIDSLLEEKDKYQILIQESDINIHNLMQEIQEKNQILYDNNKNQQELTLQQYQDQLMDKILSQKQQIDLFLSEKNKSDINIQNLKLQIQEKNILIEDNDNNKNQLEQIFQQYQDQLMDKLSSQKQQIDQLLGEKDKYQIQIQEFYKNDKNQQEQIENLQQYQNHLMDKIQFQEQQINSLLGEKDVDKKQSLQQLIDQLQGEKNEYQIQIEESVIYFKNLIDELQEKNMLVQNNNNNKQEFIENLQQQINLLNSEYNLLKDENLDLTEQLETINGEYFQYKENHKDKKSQINQINIDQQKEKDIIIKNLMKDLALKEQQPKNDQKIFVDLQEKCEYLLETNLQIKKQNQQYEEKFLQMQTQIGQQTQLRQIEDLKEKIVQLEEKNMLIQEDYNNQDEKIENLRQQINYKISENNLLEENNKNQQEQIENLLQQMILLNTEQQLIKENNLNLTEQLEAINKEYLQFKLLYQVANNQIEQQKDQKIENLILELQQKDFSLNFNQAALLLQIEELKKNDQQTIQNLQEKYDILSETNQTIKQQNQQFEENILQIQQQSELKQNELKQNIFQLQQEQQKKQLDAEKIEIQLNNEIKNSQDLQIQKQNVEKLIRQFQQQIQELQQKINAQSDLEIDMISPIQRQNQQPEDEIIQDAIQDSMMSITKKKKNNKKQQTDKELMLQDSMMGMILTDNKKISKQIEPDINQDSLSIQQQFDQKKYQFVQLQIQYNNQIDQNKIQLQTINNLQEQLDALDSKNKKQEQTLDEMQKLKAKQSSDLQKLEDLMSFLNKQKQKFQNDITSLQQNNESLSIQVIQAQQTLDTLQNQIIQTKQQKLNLDIQLQQEQQNVQNLKNQIKEKELIINNLKNQRNSLSDDNSQPSSLQTTEQQKQNEELLLKINQQQNAMQQLENEIKRKSEEDDKQLNDLQEKNNNLTQEWEEKIRKIKLQFDYQKRKMKSKEEELVQFRTLSKQNEEQYKNKILQMEISMRDSKSIQAVEQISFQQYQQNSKEEGQDETKKI